MQVATQAWQKFVIVPLAGCPTTQPTPWQHHTALPAIQAGVAQRKHAEGSFRFLKSLADSYRMLTLFLSIGC